MKSMLTCMVHGMGVALMACTPVHRLWWKRLFSSSARMSPWLVCKHVHCINSAYCAQACHMPLHHAGMRVEDAISLLLALLSSAGELVCLFIL